MDKRAHYGVTFTSLSNCKCLRNLADRKTELYWTKCAMKLLKRDIKAAYLVATSWLDLGAA
jgi:hypothetical protein